MPSKSNSQRRLMGAALNSKRGGSTFPLAQKIGSEMTEKQLKEFATKPVVKPPNPSKLTKKLKSYL